MVATGMKTALNCGNMSLAWRQWKHRPIVDHIMSLILVHVATKL